MIRESIKKELFEYFGEPQFEDYFKRNIVYDDKTKSYSFNVRQFSFRKLDEFKNQYHVRDVRVSIPSYRTSYFTFTVEYYPG